jgi:hypothetical protein
MHPQEIPSVDVYPDFGGVGGQHALTGIVGALLTITLIAAVLLLIVCAITWALAAGAGNPAAASKARTGLWVCAGTAILAGAGAAWLNFLLHLGHSL